MKKFILLNIFFLSILFADIKIIASHSCKVESLSEQDAKSLFMLKKKSINDESITVVESSDKEIYKYFIKKYLKKSSRKIKVYWTRMLFTGKKIPPKKISKEELYGLDTNNSCYISYLEEFDKPTNWKILEIK